MAEKRYFWIKLMDDFLWGDKVKFLMHQKNGAEYVVLYEMLCSLAKNSKGRLIKQLGNILIELDINAIYGELSGYFEYDTIVVAMGLYEKLDMVYQEDGNGVFTIKDFDNMVGSECASAARVRRLRENARAEQQLNPPLQSNENGVTTSSQSNEKTVTYPLQSNDNSVTPSLHSPLHCNPRVKSTEYRESMLNILKNKLSSAGAYTGVHDALIDEVLSALVLGTQLDKEITFNGLKYDAFTFERIANHLTFEQVAKVVNRLLQCKDRIVNREKYIQCILAESYGREVGV